MDFKSAMTVSSSHAPAIRASHATGFKNRNIHFKSTGLEISGTVINSFSATSLLGVDADAVFFKTGLDSLSRGRSHVWSVPKTTQAIGMTTTVNTLRAKKTARKALAIQAEKSRPPLLGHECHQARRCRRRLSRLPATTVNRPNEAGSGTTEAPPISAVAVACKPADFDS